MPQSSTFTSDILKIWNQYGAQNGERERGKEKDREKVSERKKMKKSKKDKIRNTAYHTEKTCIYYYALYKNLTNNFLNFLLAAKLN